MDFMEIQIGLTEADGSKLSALINAKAKVDEFYEGSYVEVELEMIGEGLHLVRKDVDASTVLHFNDDIRNELRKALGRHLGMAEASYSKAEKQLILKLMLQDEDVDITKYCIFKRSDFDADTALYKNTDKGMSSTARLNIELTERQVSALKELRCCTLLGNIEGGYDEGLIAIRGVSLDLRLVENRVIFSRSDIGQEVHIDLPDTQAEMLRVALKSGKVEVLDVELDDIFNIITINILSNDDYKSKCCLYIVDEGWGFEVNLGNTMDFEVSL